jgi:hypothetical protein
MTAAVNGSASLANGRSGNGGHHRRLQWVQQKETTISQGNYPNDDGAEINSGRHHASLAKDMIDEQQRQGGGEWC